MPNNIIAQVVGGKKQVIDNAETVADVRAKMNLASHYRAAINGEPATDLDDVSEGDFVSFSEAVKGA